MILYDGEKTKEKDLLQIFLWCFLVASFVCVVAGGYHTVVRVFGLRANVIAA
jgi:uncharacterized membrane protein